MLLNELYKPKIAKPIANATKEFYSNRHGTFPRSFEDNIKWLNEKLGSLGWRPYGEGGYSRVYENPKKNYILKVNTKQDKGYDKFVQLIHGLRNKHFPRISDRQELHFTQYTPSGPQPTNYCVYLIEKLQPIPEEESDNYASIISVIMDIYRYEMKPSLKKAIEQMERYYGESDMPSIKEFVMSHPELVKAAAMLGNAQKYHRVENDLHSKNIMQRSDGTIVIMDPYVG